VRLEQQVQLEQQEPLVQQVLTQLVQQVPLVRLEQLEQQEPLVRLEQLVLLVFLLLKTTVSLTLVLALTQSMVFQTQP
jgi:hypothetical protein